MASRLIVLLLSFSVTTIGLAYAQVQTITATHTYVMGDNDSRNDARQLCFLEAKRKVLEKAGSFIQSSSEVKNFELTKDQITSYSAAVLSVEIVKEDFGFTNGHNYLTLTVKADVDVADVQNRVAAIVADKSLQGKILEQQQQIRQLEQQVQALNSRLSVAPVTSTGELRKERTVVFGNIQDLENKKLAATQRISKERDKIKQNSELIRKYIVRGMTQAEVRQILGEPIRLDYIGGNFRGLFEDWFYGESTVCFREPLGRGDLRVWGVKETEESEEGCRDLPNWNR